MSVPRDRPLYMILLAILSLSGCRRDEKHPPEAGSPLLGKVEITSDPTGSAVFIDGHTRAGKTPLLLEREGGTSIDLLLVKEGFIRKNARVFFEDKKQLRSHFTLRHEQGTIVVSSGAIHGAEIAVDGKPAGSTPNRVSVAANREHQLVVTKRGFHPFQEAVTVKPAQTLEVEVYLVPANQKLRPTGWLTVASKRPVLVFIDGAMSGIAPLKRRRLVAKRYRVELRSDKRAVIKRARVVIKPGEEFILNADRDQ